MYAFLDIIENIRFNQNNTIMKNNKLNLSKQDDKSDNSEQSDLILNSKLENKI